MAPSGGMRHGACLPVLATRQRAAGGRGEETQRVRERLRESLSKHASLGILSNEELPQKPAQTAGEEGQAMSQMRTTSKTLDSLPRPRGEWTTSRPGRLAVVGVCVVLALSGCSVVMATTGKPDPNLGVVHVGATRGEMELQVGYPVSSTPVPEGGTVDIYEFEVGKNPSHERGALNGLLDLLTLGAWEVPGTLIELSVGEKRRIQVTYGPDDRVIAFRAAPPGKP